MGTFEDLTGKKFYKLTVLYRAEDYIQPSGQHKRMWHCKCECGRECDVRANDLKSGNTRSCGCFQEYLRGKSTFEDLTGKEFGRLLVLYRLPDHITPSGQKQRMWRCKCKCGKECNAYATQLKNGKISCGCIEIENKERHNIIREQEKQRKLKEKAEKRIVLLEEKRKKKEAETKIIKEKKEEKRRLNKQINSLSVKHPELLDEWDFERNKIKPEEVLSSSNQIVWWKCPSGKHSYDMAISLRTRKTQSGCPYCSSPARRVLKGFNDLKTRYPQIASEWHPILNGDLLPNNILSGSGKKVWWLCSNGHEYEQSPVNRVNGAGCPYCSHQKILKGYSDFATTNPEILSEWDYEKNDVNPSDISVGSHIKIWWKCPFGHSYQAYPANRCGKNHSGCPICDKEKHTSFPEHALFYYKKKYFPDAVNSDKTAIGMELDIYIPSLKIAIEYDGKNWHQNNKFEIKKNKECKNHNILLMRIREKGLELYDDCYCIERDNVNSNQNLTTVIKQVLFDINNILDTNVDVERDSSKIYSSYIKSRKEKSLLNVSPEIAEEWHPTKNGDLTPEMVAPTTNKKVWWLGKCGHEFSMKVSSRTSGNCDCPYCKGKRVLKGFNDFETWCISNNRKELLEEWDYSRNAISPTDVTKATHKKIYWKCSKCANVWEAKIEHRARVRCGCPKCNAVNLPKKVRCIETNEVYFRIKDAEEMTGINRHGIGNCCSGKQKTAGGYHWEYVETTDNDIK